MALRSCVASLLLWTVLAASARTPMRPPMPIRPKDVAAAPKSSPVPAPKDETAGLEWGLKHKVPPPLRWTMIAAEACPPMWIHRTTDLPAYAPAATLKHNPAPQKAVTAGTEQDPKSKVPPPLRWTMIPAPPRAPIWIHRTTNLPPYATAATPKQNPGPQKVVTAGIERDPKSKVLPHQRRTMIPATAPSPLRIRRMTNLALYAALDPRFTVDPPPKLSTTGTEQRPKLRTPEDTSRARSTNQTFQTRTTKHITTNGTLTPTHVANDKRTSLQLRTSSNKVPPHPTTPNKTYDPSACTKDKKRTSTAQSRMQTSVTPSAMPKRHALPQKHPAIPADPTLHSATQYLALPKRTSHIKNTKN
ncbi:hypothetical protein T484DRAFT_1936197, partial [Baffinella frigidus]